MGLPYFVGIVIILVYIVQGIFLSTIDKTLPTELSNVIGSLPLIQTIYLSKLPLAMKIFISPAVDSIGDLTWWVFLGQSVSVCMLGILCFSLQPTIDCMKNIGESCPSLVWNVYFPLVALGIGISLSDVAVDPLALRVIPRYRSVFQVSGVLLGRLIGNSLFLWMEFQVSFLPQIMFITSAGTLIVILVCKMIDNQQEQHDMTAKMIANPIHVVLRQTWTFMVNRKFMFWWILHQFVPPMSYFHLDVLRVRFKQRGLSLNNVASWDLILFIPALVTIVWVDHTADGKLTFFLKFYGIQVVMVIAIITVYILHGNGNIANTTTEAIFGLFIRLQDILFYIFEVGEFAFMGEVANLQPTISASLIALQTSLFNLAEVIHPMFAFYIVDKFSICSPIKCERDVYPYVAIFLTCSAGMFFVFFWDRVVDYSNILHIGWGKNNHSFRSNKLIFIFVILVSISMICLSIGALKYESEWSG